MKTTLVSAALVAVLVVGVSLASLAYGQGGAPGGNVTANGQNIAVIDIGVVFEQDNRFKMQMDQLKAEIEATEKAFKNQAMDINRQVDELKGMKPDSAKFHELEATVAKLQADFNVQKQLKNKDIMERQSKIYLRTYQEVEDAVKQISGKYNIALVIRYNSKPIDGSDPQEILRSIQRPIVFVDKQFDMTAAVTTNLNRSTAGPAATNVRPNQGVRE